MTNVDRTAPGRRSARPLAVLALLLGLLAMHGVASPHHAAAASSMPSAAPGTAADAGAHQHAPAVSLAVHEAAVTALGPRVPCDETCPDVAVLCVAVLTSAALALLVAGRRASALPSLPAGPRTPVRAPPVRLARGPDPVRELCISRT